MKLVKWLWTNADPLNKCIQSIGIIIAALWAFGVFARSQAPLLERRVGFGSTLESSREQNGKSCVLTFSLNIKNEGITPFDVGWYRIRAWRSDGPPERVPGEKELLALDLDEWQRRPTIIDMDATYGLPRHLASERNYDNTFHWVLGREKDPGWYLFRADAYDKKTPVGRKSEVTLGFPTTSWVSRVCLEEPLPEASRH
jgi:hypothetical protein